MTALYYYDAFDYDYDFDYMNDTNITNQLGFNHNVCEFIDILFHLLLYWIIAFYSILWIVVLLFMMILPFAIPV